MALIGPFCVLIAILEANAYIRLDNLDDTYCGTKYVVSET